MPVCCDRRRVPTCRWAPNWNVSIKTMAPCTRGYGAPSGGIERVDALYAIGADGAHSATRAQIGIAMDGPDDLAEFHRVEFTAPLAEIVGERRYGLYVITHPDAGGVLTPRGRGDRWGFSREWSPGQPRLVDATEDQLVELIATATGVDGLRPQIERLSAFSFAAQLAERYRERRVFSSVTRPIA